LLTSFAGQIHKHSANGQDTCLICHVTDRASVVDIDTNAGKPLAITRIICQCVQGTARLLEFEPSLRSSRAPPSSILS
jgi:hypothetical protein